MKPSGTETESRGFSVEPIYPNGLEDMQMNKAFVKTDISIEKFVGENYSAFELLELKACCNKTKLADTEESIWDYEFTNRNAFLLANSTGASSSLS